MLPGSARETGQKWPCRYYLVINFKLELDVKKTPNADLVFIIFCIEMLLALIPVLTGQLEEKGSSSTLNGK